MIARSRGERPPRRPLMVGMPLLVPLLVLFLAGVSPAQETTLPEGGGAVDPTTIIGQPAGIPLAGEALDAMTEEVASLMRCPACQGLSVADSPVASSRAIRGEVRSLLAAGYSRQQVFDYFEGAYGEFIRLSPRARGFNLVVWIAPVVMLVVGAWLVARRTRGAAAQARAETDDGLNEYRRRVREEAGY